MADTETIVNQLESKVDSVVDSTVQNTRLKRIIGIILSLAMIVLSIYAFNLQHQNNQILVRSTSLALNAHTYAASNYRSYVHKSKELKIQLDETVQKLQVVKSQLDQVTMQLNETKGQLAQTQTMLGSLQEENNRFKQELQGLDHLRHDEGVANVYQLQTKINTIKDRDTQISFQLTDLKSKLRAFEADFKNLEEGRSLIALFQTKIKYVKQRMQYLKQEALNARIEAQKEKDRLALLNGNNGFVVRHGQLQGPLGSAKSFAIDVKVVQ